MIVPKPVPAETRRVPRAALRFAAAAVTMSDTSLMNFSAENEPAAGSTVVADGVGAPPPPKAITIRARTKGVAYQAYWGRCVHDFAGFLPPDGPVPLDWNHSEDSDIGVADELTVDDEGLFALGRLIPFTANDRAAELIYKGSQKVPYQASIVMDLENLIVTEVPEGVLYTVNGEEFEGPLVVFTQWSIDGISILPYGSDSSTEVQFSRGQGDVDVPVVRSPSLEKEPQMKPVEEPGRVTPPPAAPPADAANFSRDMALKFKTDFGAAGFDWYLEGKTYEEAAKLFGASKQTEIDALSADLAKKDEAITAITIERDQLKAKAEFRRGHQTPAKVDPPAGGAAAEEKTDPAHFGRSKGMSAFIADVEKRIQPSAN
jgi:hypothetical protein